MVGMNFSHDVRRAFQESNENGRHLIAAWGPRRDNTAEPLYDYLELIPPSADGEPWTVLTLVKQNDGLTVAFNLAGRRGGYATLDEALDEFEGLADTQSDRLNEPAQFSTSADWDNVQADPDDDQDDYGPEDMGNAPEPIPGFHLDDVPPKVSATGDVDNLQAEVDRYKAGMEAERNAERMGRERDRAQEYGGIPAEPPYHPRGGRGRIRY